MSWLQRAWYGNRVLLAPLYPLEVLFCRLSQWRKQRALMTARHWRSPVPVIVVGNVSIGGTGKTPAVIWLIEALRELGYRPGVVSRGYGGKAPHYPYRVTNGSSPQACGDEPLMIVQRTSCPLVVDPDRNRAIRSLLNGSDCNVVISDDGLQHYRMARDIEIAVVDGQRGIGNGHCLPVGPLREPPRRLSQVDFCIVNGEGFVFAGGVRMALCPGVMRSLDGKAASLVPQRVHGVAGIGNPQRFFDTLSRMGFDVVPHAFPDHHAYREKDLVFDDALPVIMTEKDAVKCRALGGSRRYYLPIDAGLPANFKIQLADRLAVLNRRMNHG